jgi:hypothetical protein
LSHAGFEKFQNRLSAEQGCRTKKGDNIGGLAIYYVDCRTLQVTIEYLIVERPLKACKHDHSQQATVQKTDLKLKYVEKSYSDKKLDICGKFNQNN